MGDTDTGANAQPAIEQHQHVHRLEAVGDHCVIAFGAAVPIKGPEGAQAQATDRRLAVAEIDRALGLAHRFAGPRAATEEGGGDFVAIGRQGLDDLFGQVGGVDVVVVLQLQDLDTALAHTGFFLDFSHRRRALRLYDSLNSTRQSARSASR
ncbi:hypothetical protein D3C78_1221060 [compost metagenome]